MPIVSCRFLRWVSGDTRRGGVLWELRLIARVEDALREWTLVYADEQTIGGPANQVRPATIACPEHKTGHELDVVALADLPHAPAKVLAIGEAKATGKPVGDGELARLDHLRELIPTDKTERPSNCCCSPEADSPPNSAVPLRVAQTSS